MDDIGDHEWALTVSIGFIILADQNTFRERRREQSLIKGQLIERQKTEEALKRQAADLSIINQDLESFSYAVSHDLRASAKRQFTDPSRKN